MKPDDILILFPTAIEAAPFRTKYHGPARMRICGVGLAECAAQTALAIRQTSPGFIVLAGIAGAYPESGLQKGDTVLVVREYSADLGSADGGGFRPIAKNGGHPDWNHYDCPTPLPGLFPPTVSNTVNTAATTNLLSGTGAAIENMEGAAFFAVCEALGMPFLELRTISNIVGEPRSEWTVPQATEILADSAVKLISILTSET